MAQPMKPIVKPFQDSFNMAHNHSQDTPHYGKAFVIGIALNTIYIVVEFFYGLTVHSSSLLADAGHNTSDVLSLLLAWGAIWAAQKNKTKIFTYGYRKSTIMASIVNGILIITAGGLIVYNAIEKLQNPVDIPGNVIMLVAGIGVFINTFTALLFMKDQKNDLNIKGAFLHMAADAGVSLGVVIGGLVIKYTEAYWIDSMLSFLIVVVIVIGAWRLLRDSINLALDAVPKHIDFDKVKAFLKSDDRIKNVHDLHIWAVSTTETALTAHLVIPEGQNDDFMYELRQKLHQNFSINHSTLQVERHFGDENYCPFD